MVRVADIAPSVTPVTKTGISTDSPKPSEAGRLSAAKLNSVALAPLILMSLALIANSPPPLLLMVTICGPVSAAFVTVPKLIALGLYTNSGSAGKSTAVRLMSSILIGGMVPPEPSFFQENTRRFTLPDRVPGRVIFARTQSACTL